MVCARNEQLLIVRASEACFTQQKEGIFLAPEGTHLWEKSTVLKNCRSSEENLFSFATSPISRSPQLSTLGWHTRMVITVFSFSCFELATCPCLRRYGKEWESWALGIIEQRKRPGEGCDLKGSWSLVSFSASLITKLCCSSAACPVGTEDILLVWAKVLVVLGC